MAVFFQVFFQEIDDSVASPKQNERPPIFLIPGISGNCIELLHVAQNLKQKSKDEQGPRQVYIFHDPRLSSENTKNFSLAELIHIITEEIKELYPKGPYYIAGYSFGASLSTLVAENLKNKNNEVALCVLDSPSPQKIQDRLLNEQKEVTEELVSIIAYLAKLSGLQSRTLPKYSEDILFTLSQMPLSDRIKQISSPYTINQTMLRYLEIVEQNLEGLKTINTKQTHTIDYLTLIVTLEMQEKYHHQVIESWKEYSSELTHQILSFETHASLVEQSRGSVQTAMKMHRFFELVYQESTLIAQLKSLLTNQTRDPEQAQRILTRLEQEMSSSNKKVFINVPSRDPSPFFHQRTESLLYHQEEAKPLLQSHKKRKTKTIIAPNLFPEQRPSTRSTEQRQKEDQKRLFQL